MKPKLYKLPKTKIPWADYVWNVTTGCTKVSSGCKFCYAEAFNHRFGKGKPFGDVRFHPERLNFAPLKTEGNIIFVNSMSDLFHEKITIGQIHSVLNVIRENPKQWFVILTKRPQFAKTRFMYEVAPDNLILGVSVEDNITAPERLDLLLKTDVKYRCVSIEPYIPWKENTKKISQASEVILTRYINVGFGKKGALGKLDWVIVGAESGPRKRYCDSRFISNIVYSCKTANVPVFVKQIHSMKNLKGKFKVISDPNGFPESLRITQFPKEVATEYYLSGRDMKEWVGGFTSAPVIPACSQQESLPTKVNIKGKRGMIKRNSSGLIVIDDKQELEANSTPGQKKKLLDYYRDNNIVNIGGSK